MGRVMVTQSGETKPTSKIGAGISKPGTSELVRGCRNISTGTTRQIKRNGKPMAPETYPLFHAAVVVTVVALGVLIGIGAFEIASLQNKVRRLEERTNVHEK